MSNKNTQDTDYYEEFDEVEKTNHTNTVQKNNILVIRNIMQTENGRDWVWDYLQSCGIFESAFDKDPIQAGYNAGVRDAGLRFEREIKEHDSSHYLKMIKENI